MAEHEHEHSHDHEHHHHHDDREHEIFECAFGLVGIEARDHEQAAVVSASIEPAPESELTFGVLVKAMQRVASEVEASGGVVGHIKAFARDDGDFAHASVLAADQNPESEGDLNMPLSSDADVQLAAIALLISRQELLEIVKNSIVSE